MKRIVTKPGNWWKNLSVSSKLYCVVGIMAFLIATELFTLLFAMNTLSAVRALVGGEALWSKAQKNAVLEIQNYAHSLDPVHYAEFHRHIQIPLGDRQARMEMEKPNMNMEVVREGFLKGQLHNDDIEPVVKMLRRFYQISYLSKALGIWGEGDKMMTRLIETAERLHQIITDGRAKGRVDRVEIEILLIQISEINDHLTQIETDFSYVLGEASRWLEHVLMYLLITAVAMVETTGLLLTITFSRRLRNSLDELTNFANQVGTGNLTTSLPVRSTDELGNLAMALNKMALDLKEVTVERQVADRSNQVKSLFLANMSHEIRTPLNSILGFVDLLRDGSLSRPEREKYLDIIERTGNSVATIINDILDISKVEAGKLEISKSDCSVKQLLNDLKLILRLRAEAKGIYLDFREGNVPDHIITDSTRVKQILLNVIGNAIKFTDRGGVTVTIDCEGKLLKFIVDDTGVGIAGSSIEHLFQPFSQADLSIRKKFGGTGLGLILSRKLAQILGGDVILLRSDLGKGSTFVVTVGFEEPGKASPPLPKPVQEATEPMALKGTRILVVEDSLDNQLLAQQYLGKAGAQVELASHGQQAVEMAAHNEYDIVLMDMQMPVMDGYTATLHLRKMGCEIPIIALTAHAMKEDLEKCLSAGCNSYLSKPYRRDGLISLVARYCRPAVAA